MNAKHTTQDKNSDPRPNYSRPDIDKRDTHHIHDTKTQVINIITKDGDREFVRDLDGHQVSEWITYVERNRGWDTRLFFGSAGDAVTNALEVQERDHHAYPEPRLKSADHRLTEDFCKWFQGTHSE